MIKAKEISVRNIVILVVVSFAVTVGYYLSRPHFVTTKSIPVFVGEEVTVRKATESTIGVEKVFRAEGALKAKKVAFAKASMAKGVVAPLPTPKVTAPLPIIPPSVTFKVLPTYPVSALERGLEGTVILSIYVGLNGQPERIETKVSSGVQELDEVAIGAVSQWRFSPATQGGQAIASWYEIPVRFEVK
ncbi:MAG: energy transducer TonB [Candidatus Methanomethylicaceae archaeon]